MKIQLIHPPVYLNVHALTALRPSMPLGLAYIGAVLREDGHEISVLDAVAEAPDQITEDHRIHRLGLTPAQIIARLDADADAFALTNMWSFSWPLVQEIITRIKTRFPNKPLIAGGEHFTGMPEHSLRTAPIDYIILGEGESGAVELFRHLEERMTTGKTTRSIGTISGIIFLRDGEVIRTASRPRNREINRLPWPAWDLFDIETYNRFDLVTGLHLGMTVPILATRGCPYQCTYCSSPKMWTTRYVTREPRDVVDEIEHYHRVYKAINFPFQDLTAIVKKDWIIDFCNELIRRDLGISWQFPTGTRCEVIDEEVASLLHQSGCRSMAFAPESGSGAVRERIKKRMKDESLFRAVKASVKNKLSITSFFVLGFPEDTPKDYRDTEKLVRKLARMGIDDIAIGFFFPIPNTAIFDQLLEKGRIQMDDEFLMTPIFANEARLMKENSYCENMSPRQVTIWKYRLLLNFYGISFAMRPWRLAQIFWNALRGKETRKLETFLVELKRRRGTGAPKKTTKAA